MSGDVTPLVYQQSFLHRCRVLGIQIDVRDRRPSGVRDIALEEKSARKDELPQVGIRPDHEALREQRQKSRGRVGLEPYLVTARRHQHPKLALGIRQIILQRQALSAYQGGYISLGKLARVTRQVLDEVTDGIVAGHGALSTIEDALATGRVSSAGPPLLHAMVDAGYYSPVQRISDLV